MAVDNHNHDGNGAAGNTGSGSSSSPLPKLYSTIDEVNNRLKNNQSPPTQNLPSRNLPQLCEQPPSSTEFKSITTSSTSTAKSTPHLFLHFDINETILIGDPAGGDSVEECLNKVIAKSAFVSTQIVDALNSQAHGSENGDANGRGPIERRNEGVGGTDAKRSTESKRSPRSGDVSLTGTRHLEPSHWWNGVPLASSSKNNSVGDNLDCNAPPPLYTGWTYPPQTCPYYRTAYKKHAKQFTEEKQHGRMYRPLYNELCVKVGVDDDTPENDSNGDGDGGPAGNGAVNEDGGNHEQEGEDTFDAFIPAFFHTLQHYFPSNSGSNASVESSSIDDSRNNPPPPPKVTLVLRTFGTDLPKVAKAISAFARGKHPNFTTYYNEDLILNEDNLFCGGWRYLDAAGDVCSENGGDEGGDDDKEKELIYELHPPPANNHNQPTPSKASTAIHSGDDEVLNYLQSKTIVGIQDDYPFWRDHNLEPWSGKPVWARVNVSSTNIGAGVGSANSGHISHHHHHILLDDNIHNDPHDGAGGIRIPSISTTGDHVKTSDHTVYDSLHGNEALQMHGKHLIRVPTIRPLMEDDWFIRQIEQARLAVFLEDGGDGKSGKDEDKESATVKKDPLSLVLTNRNLEENDFRYMKLPLNLIRVNLSRNRLKSLPDQIFAFSRLTILDVSRNSLQGFPTAIKRLRNLVELNALSNHLRMSQLPLEELASMTNLRVLDLRYNRKLKQSALATLDEALLINNPQLEILCTIAEPAEEHQSKKQKKKKLSACDRDATLLQSQLEPLSTPQLAKRLKRSFHVQLDKDMDLAYDREYIMKTLLQCYAQHGPREIRYEKGIPAPSHRLSALHVELEAIPWPKTTRERPKIRAEYYMILQKPGSGKADSARTKKETAKLNKYRRLFDMAVETLKEVDADFADRFTALAVTKNFVGSPHIDTLNVGPFYGLSLGEFTGGGNIAVECSPFLVAEVETRGSFGKVDGRFPHWVTPYEGTRYSLIYYVTSGSVEPQTTAIFSPPQPPCKTKSPAWIPPPTFVP